MEKKEMTRRLGIRLPARIKQVSYPKVVPWAILSGIKRSLLSVFSRSKKGKSAARRLSNSEKRRIALRYLRQPPFIRKSTNLVLVDDEEL